MTARGSRAPWRGTRSLLLQGGTIYSPSAPFSTAMLIVGDTIAWIGEDTAAAVHRDAADVVINLDGAFVAPGFVDAHVHATSTGLMITGMDLTAARSREELLDRLRVEADRVRGSWGPDAVVLGHGWDESQWDDPALPTREDIDAAAGGAQVYLSRIDVHSALVSTSLVEGTQGADAMAGWHPTHSVSQQAHISLRAHALTLITSEQRNQAQRGMRRAAAELGIVAVHEMAGPGISGPDDLLSLLDLADSEPGPLVVGYWGESAQTGGVDRALELGAVGAAGDLFVDGAIGSHTACLHDSYTDDPESTGAAYLTAAEISEHLIASTTAGMQAGFHVIGDLASHRVSEGARNAARALGTDALRQAGHRLEHAEMLSDDDIEVMAELGITASMQPLFDELWGGPGGMYEARLGAARTLSMNRFADIASAGVALAFGSDSPVTPLGPWAAVRAAMHHTVPAQRLSARAAFSAHTRGGWRAAGSHGTGVLAPGAPAHLAIWDVREFEVHAPDERVTHWSTDPRSGTPALPVLDPGGALPQCLATIAAGAVIHAKSGHAVAESLDGGALA